MKITNIHNLPEPLVKVLTHDDYTFEGDISTTALISPPRIRQLKKRYRKLLVADVSDTIYPLIGKNAHYILQRIGELMDNVIVEKRFKATFQDWVLSGQIDLLETDYGILSDYKITSVWSELDGVKPETEAQLNVNAMLVMLTKELVVTKLQAVNLLRDWSKFRTGENYPPCQARVHEVPFWRPNETLDYIGERILLHQQSEEQDSDDLPYCTSQERWDKPTTYAVKKPKRKSAIRVLDTQEDAEKYIADKNLDDTHFIEVREGERTRCEHYCIVAEFCNQFKEFKEATR